MFIFSEKKIVYYHELNYLMYILEVYASKSNYKFYIILGIYLKKTILNRTIK